MKILIASPICAQAIAHLQSQHDVVSAVGASQDELRAAIHDREAIVFRSGVDINQTVLSNAPHLQLVIRAGSGLDNLDVGYVERNSMALVRIPEPGAQAVAELAFGLMLALARQIPLAHEQLREGHWIKNQVTGYLLRGKVLGIVGAGNIGCRVGEMGAAWGMQSIGCVEVASATEKMKLERHGIRLAEFPEVLSQADFLSIHVPLQATTRNLIDSAAIKFMKPSAFLINMSRGGVVNESDLLEALRDHQRLAGAALDVHQVEGEGNISPLASLPNVVLTPHIGAATVDTVREIGQRVVDVIDHFAAERSDCNNQNERCGDRPENRLRRA